MSGFEYVRLVETKKEFSSPNCELIKATWDPGILIPLAISAILYWRGSRSSPGIRDWEKLSFWGGWVVLAAALVSPLHRLGEVLFSAHMVQHELLMVVAAPLLLLGRPLLPFRWALPIGWRFALGKFCKTTPVQSAWRGLTDPLVAWCIQAIVLWDWHAPVMFQATLGSEFVHTLQHLSFLLSSLLFWWAVMHGQERRMGSSGSLVYLFTTAIHTSLLGALLTFSPHLWYPAYATTTQAWGLTPLQDQQLGGLILWVPAGISYIIAGLAVTAKSLRLSGWRVFLREQFE
jgi:cytochrome c oxidase assembly factor CtaG